MFLLRTRFLPLAPYCALTIGPLLLIRRGAKLTPSLLRHEQIHWRQCRELLVFGFYIWYLLEWMLRLIEEAFRPSDFPSSFSSRPDAARTGRGLSALSQRAYFRISFEREAYTHQSDYRYLPERPLWAFRKYL